MSRSERVVYVNFSVVSKLFAERFVFLFLLPVEAEVFKKYSLAVL